MAQPAGRDQYQVIMWSTGTPRDFTAWIERLKEIGFTAEECGAGRDALPYARAGFGFYVENLAPELGFLNNRRPIYDADFQAYTATRDRQHLVRKPCLDDPSFWETARPRLESLVRPYIPLRPLLYQLRDELSIATLASPMDYCFGPHTLAAFREWLRGRYGSVEALNQEWETAFAAWDEVTPMTTYEIKDRERAALAAGRPENYAPWADHREFMDLTFARSIDRLRGWVRELDPATPVGIEGTQMPSAWGGFDLWRLSRAVDWIEPYDIAGSREILRSFLPQGATILSTVFGSDFNRIRQKLWSLLLHGDRGAIVWDDDASRSVLKDQEGLPLTDRGRGLAPVFAELKEAAPLLFRLRRLGDGIAIHYSQASLRAHWMIESRVDRDTWPRRFSSYEAAFSKIARVRDGYMRVMEDLGLQYDFVSYEQIEEGGLAGYKVLLMPQSVAMSERECRRIEEFVREGGAVIADDMVATMNEHCRRLPRGRLDELFATGGRATRVTAAMGNYGRERLQGGGDATRELFARLLGEAGVAPAVRVTDAETGAPARCVEVWRYEGEDGRYVAVMRSPEFNATSSLKQAGYPDNSAIENTLRIVVEAGEEKFEADLEPWRPVLLKLE